MKILRRTKGIDFKAKNSSLHGSVVIQFRDPTTGKVTDEEKHDNFFTDALKSVLNGCPFGLNNKCLMGGDAYSSDNISKFGSMYEWLLGGILLFPQSLGSDATELYAPFTNYPTALASMESYTHRSNRQGNFNSAESSPLSNGGYRYVYDWSTSQGVGNIASVALSHRRCYEYFNDGAIPFFPKCTHSQANLVSGYYGYRFGDNSARFPMAVCDDGVVASINASGSNWLKARFYKVAPYDFQLIASLNGDIPEYLPDGVTRPFEFAWEADYSSEFSTAGSAAYLSYQFDNGTLYAWQKNSTGTSDITIITIDISDGSVLTSQTLRFAAPDSPTSGTANNSGHFAIKNGYLYMSTMTGGKVYKCNLANVSDVTEISCNSNANDYLWATDDSDFIYSRSCVINNDIPSDMIFDTPNYNAGKSQFYNDGRNIVYEKGVWIVNATPQNGYMGAQIKTPYLATKNNLDSTKTKSTDKTMKVIYTVTQQ